MSQPASRFESGTHRSNAPEPRAPAWATCDAGEGRQRRWQESPDIDCSVVHGATLDLMSVRVRGARHMRATDLQEATTGAYRAVFAETADRNLVRVWNFIPGLLEPVDDADQRYKVFNSGRFDAFRERFPDPAEFDANIPTASGVGTANDDLEIHALASTARGVPIGNPRQVESYRYSPRFGTVPPCFARATAVDWPAPGGSRRLLVGGTASVRGEETMFAGDLELQADETFVNLAAVIASGLGMNDSDFSDPTLRAGLLGRFRHVRTYYPACVDRRRIADIVARALPATVQVELAEADLCRGPLLIEIEGWADLSP